jgi:hypothetical protein
VTTIAIDRNQKPAVLSEIDDSKLERAERNAEYLEKLDRSFRQLEEGRVVVKTMEELEADESGINPDDYDNDTDYLNAIPGMTESIIESMNAPLSEFKPVPRKYFNV